MGNWHLLAYSPTLVVFYLLLKTDMKAQNQSGLTKKHITGSMVMTCPFVITSHGLINILPVTLLSMVSGFISTNVEHILRQVYIPRNVGYTFCEGYT